jgi:V/A-type H+-transporting ATPase subunit D
MRLNIKPTRMELLKLRRRIVIARHGYDLLEERRNELMKRFLSLIKEVESLREEVEEELGKALKEFLIARCLMSHQSMGEALLLPKQRLSLKISWKSPFASPRFDLEKEATPEGEQGDIYCYGFVDTPENLDTALGLLSEILPSLLRLAQLEAEIEVLSGEIERTRRRVNALKYILIPQLEETIKYIAMKLEELERSHLVMLMKMKEVLRRKK